MITLRDLQEGRITPNSALPPLTNRPTSNTNTNNDWRLQSINSFNSINNTHHLDANNSRHVPPPPNPIPQNETTSSVSAPNKKNKNKNKNESKSKYIVDLPSENNSLINPSKTFTGGSVISSTANTNAIDTNSAKPPTKSTKRSRKRRLDFSRKLRAIEKQRSLRLDAARQRHEQNLQQHRHKLFLRRAAQTEREKTVSFEFTQRLQSTAQQNFGRLATLDADHRRCQATRDRQLISALSKARELLAVKSGSWDELHDPETGAVYYFDCSTGHSQWERPSEMDATSAEVGAVTCAICLDICTAPTSCRNGHLYCLECLRAHLAVSPNASCPTCRVAVVGDGTRNMLAEDLVVRLRKANQHMESSETKRTQEETLLKKHQSDVEADASRLEAEKRRLSRALQTSCAELRTIFETEWKRMVDNFEDEMSKEHDDLSDTIESYEVDIEKIEAETTLRIEALEKEYGVKGESVLSVLWGEESWSNTNTSGTSNNDGSSYYTVVGNRTRTSCWKWTLASGVSIVMLVIVVILVNHSVLLAALEQARFTPNNETMDNSRLHWEDHTTDNAPSSSSTWITVTEGNVPDDNLPTLPDVTPPTIQFTPSPSTSSSSTSSATSPSTVASFTPAVTGSFTLLTNATTFTPGMERALIDSIAVMLGVDPQFVTLVDIGAIEQDGGRRRRRRMLSSTMNNFQVQYKITTSSSSEALRLDLKLSTPGTEQQLLASLQEKSTTFSNVVSSYSSTISYNSGDGVNAVKQLLHSGIFQMPLKKSCVHGIQSLLQNGSVICSQGQQMPSNVSDFMKVIVKNIYMNSSIEEKRERKEWREKMTTKIKYDATSLNRTLLSAMSRINVRVNQLSSTLAEHTQDVSSHDSSNTVATAAVAGTSSTAHHPFSNSSSSLNTLVVVHQYNATTMNKMEQKMENKMSSLVTTLKDTLENNFETQLNDTTSSMLFFAKTYTKEKVAVSQMQEDEKIEHISKVIQVLNRTTILSLSLLDVELRKQSTKHDILSRSMVFLNESCLRQKEQEKHQEHQEHQEQHTPLFQSSLWNHTTKLDRSWYNRVTNETKELLFWVEHQRDTDLQMMGQNIAMNVARVEKLVNQNMTLIQSTFNDTMRSYFQQENQKSTKTLASLEHRITAGTMHMVQSIQGDFTNKLTEALQEESAERNASDSSLEQSINKATQRVSTLEREVSKESVVIKATIHNVTALQYQLHEAKILNTEHFLQMNRTVTSGLTDVRLHGDYFARKLISNATTQWSEQLSLMSEERAADVIESVQNVNISLRTFTDKTFQREKEDRESAVAAIEQTLGSAITTATEDVIVSLSKKMNNTEAKMTKAMNKDRNDTTHQLSFLQTLFKEDTRLLQEELYVNITKITATNQQEQSFIHEHIDTVQSMIHKVNLSISRRNMQDATWKSLHEQTVSSKIKRMHYELNSTTNEALSEVVQWCNNTSNLIQKDASTKAAKIAAENLAGRLQLSQSMRDERHQREDDVLRLNETSKEYYARFKTLAEAATEARRQINQSVSLKTTQLFDQTEQLAMQHMSTAAFISSLNTTIYHHHNNIVAVEQTMALNHENMTTRHQETNMHTNAKLQDLSTAHDQHKVTFQTLETHVNVNHEHYEEKVNTLQMKQSANQLYLTSNMTLMEESVAKARERMQVLNTSVETRTNKVELLLEQGMRAVRNDLGYLQTLQQDALNEIKANNKVRSQNISKLAKSVVNITQTLNRVLIDHHEILPELNARLLQAEGRQDHTEHNMTVLWRSLTKEIGDHTITRTIQEQQQSQLSQLSTQNNQQKDNLLSVKIQNINTSINLGNAMQQLGQNISDQLEAIVTSTSLARSHLTTSLGEQFSTQNKQLRTMIESQLQGNITNVAETQSLLKNTIQQLNTSMTDSLETVLHSAQRDRNALRQLIMYNVSNTRALLEAHFATTTLEQSNRLRKGFALSEINLLALGNDVRAERSEALLSLELHANQSMIKIQEESREEKVKMSTLLAEYDQNQQKEQQERTRNDTLLALELEVLKSAVRNVSADLRVIQQESKNTTSATNTVIEHHTIHHYYNTTAGDRNSDNDNDKSDNSNVRMQDDALNISLLVAIKQLGIVEDQLLVQTESIRHVNDTVQSQLFLLEQNTVALNNKTRHLLKTETALGLLLLQNKNTTDNMQRSVHGIAQSITLEQQKLKDLEATMHVNMQSNAKWLESNVSQVAAQITVQMETQINTQINMLDNLSEQRVRTVEMRFNQTHAEEVQRSDQLHTSQQQNLTLLQQKAAEHQIFLQQLGTDLQQEKNNSVANIAAVRDTMHRNNRTTFVEMVKVERLGHEMASLLRPRVLLSMTLVGQQRCARGALCHYSAVGLEEDDVLHWLSKDKTNNDDCSLGSSTRATSHTTSNEMLVKRPIHSANDTSRVCHSRSTSSLLSFNTQQIAIMLPPKVSPSVIGVQYGAHHSLNSIVTKAIQVPLYLQFPISIQQHNVTQVGLVPVQSIGCRGVVSVISVTNVAEINITKIQTELLPPNTYALCSTTKNDHVFTRQPVHIEVVKPHAHAMVSTHQLSTSYYRLVLTHMQIGDHIAFVDANVNGCAGASQASYNMTSSSIASTLLGSSATHTKLCYAPKQNILNSLSDTMFFDEGILMRPTSRVVERSVITDASQSVSSSSMTLGADPGDSGSLLYVSDYVNGKIHLLSTNTEGVTTKTLFANNLNQIMSIHRDVVNSDIYACDLHPGNVWKIPALHSSNPGVYPAQILNPDASLTLPIALVRDDSLKSGEIFILLGGDTGSIARLHHGKNSIYYLLVYVLWFFVFIFESFAFSSFLTIFISFFLDTCRRIELRTGIRMVR